MVFGSPFRKALSSKMREKPGMCWNEPWAAPRASVSPKLGNGPALVILYFFLEPLLDAFNGLTFPCAWAAVSSLTWVAKLQ